MTKIKKNRQCYLINLTYVPFTVTVIGVHHCTLHNYLFYFMPGNVLPIFSMVYGSPFAVTYNIYRQFFISIQFQQRHFRFRISGQVAEARDEKPAISGLLHVASSHPDISGTFRLRSIFLQSVFKRTASRDQYSLYMRR